MIKALKKALEINTSMLFDLDFAINTILSYFLIPVVIAQSFYPIADLVIPIGIPSNEAKAEIEIHPVILDII